MSSPSAPLPSHKTAFLDLCLKSNILTFGSFTLKSGRTSPYFFQAGLFNTSKLLSALSTAYAKTIIATSSIVDFDVVFGPAYKGIPLATLTCTKLGELDPTKYGNVGYSFNRKEKKDHGEGGGIVGMTLKGKKVVVVDDVMTAGTAMKEAVEIIRAEGGTLVGIIVCLDRQERMTDGKKSAIEYCRKEYGVPVEAILTLEDIIIGVSDEEQKEKMKKYREIYAPEKDE